MNIHHMSGGAVIRHDNPNLLHGWDTQMCAASHRASNSDMATCDVVRIQSLLAVCLIQGW